MSTPNPGGRPAVQAEDEEEQTMKRWMALGAGVAAATGLLLVGGQAAADDDAVSAVLRDPTGARVGWVKFTEHDDETRVNAMLRRNKYVATDAFHGFHVHANNDPANGRGCKADAQEPMDTWFVSADGHLAKAGQTHGHHDGDLPSPLVMSDGTAVLKFSTDRIDADDLEGKAVILHAKPDNFGNVPTGDAADQYTPNSAAATDATQRTGNAGDRVACGVLDD